MANAIGGVHTSIKSTCWEKSGRKKKGHLLEWSSSALVIAKSSSQQRCNTHVRKEHVRSKKCLGQQSPK